MAHADICPLCGNRIRDLPISKAAPPKATMVGRQFTTRDFIGAKKYRQEIREIFDEALGR